LNKTEMLALWEEVKANGKRLDECYGPHDFVQMTVEEAQRHSPRFKCGKCKGVVDNHAHVWYKLGLKHGGRG